MNIPWRTLGVVTGGLAFTGLLMATVGLSFENNDKERKLDILKYQLNNSGVKPFPIYHD